MKVSSKSRYALLALVELDLRTGGGSHPVRLADLARDRGIPPAFLEQLFARLRGAGILTGRRGMGGGFTFARPPGLLTVLDVVEALDGADDINAGVAGGCEAEDRDCCGIVWRTAVAAYDGVLAGVTISDLAERERLLPAGVPMYEI